MKTVTNFAATAALAITAGLMATPSHALEYSYASPAAGGFVRVNVPIETLGISQATPDGGFYTPAGPFNVSVVDNGTPVETFVAWCFELEENFLGGAKTNPSFNTALTSAQRGRVLNVFDANYSDSFLTGTGNTNRGAALQLALWEAIYDSDFDLTFGTFTSAESTASGDKKTPSAVFDLAQTYLDQADGYTGDRKWSLTTLEFHGAQDLGTVSTIPLPAAAWLLLAASGGLVAAKRRRASADT